MHTKKHFSSELDSLLATYVDEKCRHSSKSQKTVGIPVLL